MLDLRKIPTSSVTPPTRPASFYVVNDATASLPPDKTTITSSLALPWRRRGSFVGRV